MEELPVNIVEVLKACTNGQFPQELKILYQFPYRNRVRWLDFPNWARPDVETEGCHEG